MRYFTPSHEWLQVDGKIGVVGITHYAQKELGPIVHIELPKIGAVLQAGCEAAVLESTKAAADIYAPTAGKVVAVNEALRSNPSLVNQDAEGMGWLFRFELIGKDPTMGLLSQTEYLEAVQK